MLDGGHRRCSKPRVLDLKLRARTSCRRHDIAAFLTGSKILVAEEVLVCLGNRILGVIAHYEALFMQQSVAFPAVPVKAVDLSFAPLALRDKRKGIGRKARRVSDAGRSIDD